LIALVCLGAVFLAGWFFLFSEERRASIFIGDAAFTDPVLHVNEQRIPEHIGEPCPFRQFAWADLQMPSGDVRLEVAWTGADGQRRLLRQTVHQGGDSLEPHCAYFLSLDAQGAPAPPAHGMRSDRMASFCHFGR
jgi:hypothetical protein